MNISKYKPSIRPTGKIRLYYYDQTDESESSNKFVRFCPEQTKISELPLICLKNCSDPSSIEIYINDNLIQNEELNKPLIKFGLTPIVTFKSKSSKSSENTEVIDLKSTQTNEFIDLSRFQKLDKIGQGSFGKVYKVKESNTGTIYACKISLRPLTEEEKSLQRNLKREIDISAQLNHPSVLKFFGYSPINFQGEPKPVIITEYSSNGTLASILKLERQSISLKEWDDTRKLINIFGIASAMKYLHSNNIIHRDLKPENILEDEYLFPKIADFGLSKNFHTNEESMSLESNSGIKGTPVYIPPETWIANEYSKSGDVYTFSLIVYEIMTLEQPFKNFNLPRFYSDVVGKCYRPEFKYPIADCYKKLINKCWLNDPKERPTFDEIVTILKEDEEFILDTIDKNEFFDYVEYIENSDISFDKSKKFKKITLSKDP